MRFLIVGAGALGGYFGGRLLAKQQDVTFLVRPRRAAELAASGLAIKSPFGDLVIPNPPSVLADQIEGPFDVVLVGCKAYDLVDTMESIAAAVGPGTAILPLLNGMGHIAALQQRFGPTAVLGGQCLISAALGPGGVILHLNDAHTLGYGELDGENSARVQSITAAFSGALFDARPSLQIVQEMWEKWVFIASAAGITCLMRASIGDIVEAGAAPVALALYDECSAVARQAGHPPRDSAIQRSHAVLSMPGSPITASMLKDIERGAATEAEHILGDLLNRGESLLPQTSLLRLAYGHLKAYAARRRRESASAGQG